MSTKSRRIRAARRPPPAPRLIESGQMGDPVAPAIHIGGAPEDQPLTLMRLGAHDLSAGIAAIRQGARPTAVVTGFGETPRTTRRARRLTRDVEVPWLADPLLFKTALPGYRSAAHLQDVDYAPGRDADPFSPDDFFSTDLLRRVGRASVGVQRDIGAAGAWGGAFVTESINDPWTAINSELMRISIDARDAVAAGPIFVAVPLRMKGFDGVESQRLLVRTLMARRPDAFVLMLDGLHEGSSADRLVACLRLGLLLQSTGVPVVLGRAGALRQMFWAFGLRGAEFGLGRLLRFYVPDYKSKGGGGDPPARFEAPSLVFGLPAKHALKALGRELIPDATCACPSCAAHASPGARVDHAAEHGAHVVMGQAAALAGRETTQRVLELDGALANASHLWWELRNAGIDIRAPVDNWRRAIDLAVESGLLEPARVAAEIRLFD